MKQTTKAFIASGILAFSACISAVECQIGSNSSDKLYAYVEVDVKNKPTDSQWKRRKTVTLDCLRDFKSDVKPIGRDIYGGRMDVRAEAKGFFYPLKINERWWLVDPQGHPFVHIAVVSVYPGLTEMARNSTMQKFGTIGEWADFSTDLLSQYGFNGTGGWSEASHLRKSKKPLVYTLSWNFMGDFGQSKNLVKQESGHLGYPNKCIPVFHPDFESFCTVYAERLRETFDDPWLLGHFSDNELPIPADLLDRSLQLDINDPNLKHGNEAAAAWLAKRKGKDSAVAHITDADRKAFVEYVLDRYYRITAEAIRRVDCNHLCLGSRIHGNAKKYPEVFRAAGRYLDVISVNYYNAWDPDHELMMMWYNESGKPVIVTEWYAKGMDSGLDNQSGAGCVVKTQRDRGLFYQNFSLGLMKSKVCVGWHWFKFRDNDPGDISTDPSNRDSNKGIVDYQYRPYYPLLNEMKQINENVYELIDYFDFQ